MIDANMISQKSISVGELIDMLSKVPKECRIVITVENDYGMFAVTPELQPIGLYNGDVGDCLSFSTDLNNSNSSCWPVYKSGSPSEHAPKPAVINNARINFFMID
jgi:hypothetical protein